MIKSFRMFLALALVMLGAVSVKGQESSDYLTADEVNILEVGKTYLLGEQYGMYEVQFTAEKDGFLSITPSQKVNCSGLKINGSSSTFTKVNGGIDKKGMAAGSVFTGRFYCTGIPSDDNVYSLTVTFEEGVPYSPLALTLASPADGGEWSGAAQYKNYGVKGAAHYEFSSVISADVVASVKIGEKVYSPIKCNVDSYNPKLDITALPDTLSKAIAAGLIKAGETFTLTLSNIVDREFAANTLADQTFTYTLAPTACTGVSPTASISRTTMVTDVAFSFDGTVALADTAKFYMVNLANNEKTELTGEVVDGTSVVIAVPAVEGLLPRKYNIVAEGVTTAEGDRVITYGNEPGKLVASYGTSNGFFKATTSLQNWSQVHSLKGFTATYPGEVIKVDGIATKPITFVKVDETTGAEEEMTDVTLGYTINGNVIEFALSKAITEPGIYRFSVPQKHFWAKDTYTEEDAKLSTPLYAYYQPSITLTIDVIELVAIDVTDKLVNPNFDDANANTGWTAGSKKLQFGTSGDVVRLKDGRIFVGNIVEHWESTPWTGDFAQNVTGLPAGAYKFTMGAYANKAGVAYIFANDSLSLPLDSAKVGEYATYVELSEGADLKVGVKNVSGINLIVMDNAHLYYYGEGTTVDMALKADWKVTLAAVDSLKAAYADPIEVEALDAVIAAAKTSTVQEYLASIKAVETAMATFKKVNDYNALWNVTSATLAGATAENPVDATAFIKNPSFEDGQTWIKNGTGGGAINQPDEWKLSMEQEGWGDVCKNETTPQDGKYIFNTWTGTLHSINLNQAVRLPGGSYILTAAMRTEWTHQVTNQHIYAVIGTDTIHGDSLKVADIMRHTGDDATNANAWNTVDAWQTLTTRFSLKAETIVTIGLLSTGGTSDNAGWFQLDNFRLSCTGWVDPIMQPALDSLNTLIVEVEAYQETLDLTIPTQQMVHDTLTKDIETARLIAETGDTISEIRYAYTNLYSAYATAKIHLAMFEADAARAYPGTGELIDRIYDIAEYMPIMGSEYTLSDLDAAVQELRELVESLKVNVTGIYLDYDTLWMNRDDVMELFATVAPENATDKTVTWYSSNESVATVNNGIVTAVGMGETYVVACAGVYADTCVVSVWEDTENKNILIEDLKLKIGEVEAWWSSLSETDTIRMMVIENAEYLVQTAETLVASQPTVAELEEKIQELVSFMESYPEMLDAYDAAVEAIRIAEELIAAHPEVNSISLESYMSRLERELSAYGLNKVSRVQRYTDSLNSRIESFRDSLNYFTIPNVETRLYEPFTVPVSMANEDGISAFQCDIYLHGGLEMNLNDEGDYDIKLNSTRATSSHTVASELQADGAIRVIVYSNGSKLFNGNSGELFTIGLTALSAEAPVDTVTGISIGVSVQNIRLSTSDEREILIAGVDAHVTVKTHTPADVNGDGTVSIVDVVAVVNNILGRNAGNFVFEAADMDQNGEITIVDVVAVVNVLLGKDVQALGARSLLRSSIHVADAEVNAGGTTTLYVKLDNAQTYTAMQLDVDLPEGLTVEGVEMVGCPSHTAVFNEAGRIAVYSLNNSRFNSGESLMAITVKADDGFTGNGLVGFTNVRVVSADVRETVLADVLANIAGGGATGIDGLLADEKVQILYYSTTGAVSDKPHKGLNVIKRIYEDGRVEVSKEVRE